MSREPDNVTDLPLPGPPSDPLARALTRLEPAEAHLNRDRLMFQAGAESRRHVIRLWQFTAGLLAAVGFAAGARVYFYEPEVVEKIVYVEREAANASSREVAPLPHEVPQHPGPGNASFPPGDGAPAEGSIPGIAPPYVILGHGETAEWLRLRNDILTGGLGLLPDYGRQPPPRALFEE